MPMGMGLDGAVASMCALPSRSSIVVAGSFTRAWNLQAPFEVKTGGLATWIVRSNSSSASSRTSAAVEEEGFWAPLAAAAVQGSVSALLCEDNMDEVFVGGALKFMPASDHGADSCTATSFNASTASGLEGGAGLVMLDLLQGAWRPLAGEHGVVGGQVLAMATYGDNLFVGGDFVSVGGVVATGFAVCKRFRHPVGAQWFALTSLDGSVRSRKFLPHILPQLMDPPI